MKRTALLFLIASLLSVAAPALSAGSGATPIPAAEAGAGDRAVLLDVNRANVEELLAVPGIGSSIAGAILEARERRGAFSSLEDLLEVKGIGEKRLAELRLHLRVVPSETAGRTTAKE